MPARPHVALSVLDLSPVAAGSSGAVSLRNSLDLARLADRLGFTRYWVAEHHNLASIASSAPDIMIGQVAAVTERIQVGSGGVMLPNHAPLMVAERFKVLEALFPGRIDLGIGRAPGTDPVTSIALRRREEAQDSDYAPIDRERIRQNRARLLVGSKERIKDLMAPLIDATQADEIMITTMIYDHQARKHSYELIAEAFELAG